MLATISWTLMARFARWFIHCFYWFNFQQFCWRWGCFFRFMFCSVTSRISEKLPGQFLSSKWLIQRWILLPGLLVANEIVKVGHCCMEACKLHHCWAWFAAHLAYLLRTVISLRSPSLNKVLIFVAGSLSKSELIFPEESLCIVRGATQVFPNVQVCVHCQTYDDIRFFIVCHCIPKVKIRLHPMVGQGDRIWFRGGSICWMRHFSGRVVFLWHLVDFKGKWAPCLLAVARVGLRCQIVC